MQTPPPLLDDDAPDEPPDPLPLDEALLPLAELPEELLDALPDDDPDEALPDPELLADEDVELPPDDPALPLLPDDVPPDSTVESCAASDESEDPDEVVPPLPLVDPDADALDDPELPPLPDAAPVVLSAPPASSGRSPNPDVPRSASQPRAA